MSRVLNNHPDVSEKAKARVLAVVEQYGFEPNANARHLKMQAPSAIAVLVKGMQNLLFADILEQIQSLLQGSGEEVYVAYLDEDEDEVQHALRLTQLRHPKGFLFLGGDLACFAAEFSGVSVPAVLLTNGARELGFPNLSSFTTHDESAAEQAIDYLYQRGHRRIHVLGGNRSGTQISARRLLGVQRAMERHGLPCELERIHEPCRYSMEDGYQGARRLLERDPGVTALFALGDVIALGAVRAVPGPRAADSGGYLAHRLRRHRVQPLLRPPADDHPAGRGAAGPAGGAVASGQHPAGGAPGPRFHPPCAAGAGERLPPGAGSPPKRKERCLCDKPAF